MGFAPAEVGAMSLWQFNCCWAAYLAAKTGEDGIVEMSDAEFDAAAAMI